MTPIDPFERQLPAALTRLADPRTPDYLTDILGRTARTRQRSAWRSLERWLPVPSLTSPRTLALLVVAALAAVILGSALLGGGGGPTPGPSPSTSAAAATPSSASPTQVPDELLGGWVAPSRGTGPEDSQTTFIEVGQPSSDGPVRLWVDRPGFNPIQSANVSQMSAGVLSLEAVDINGGCAPGDLGSYRWSTTSDGQWLTFDAVEDACDARAAVLPGTWQRSLAHSHGGGPGIFAAFSPFFTATLPPGEYVGRGVRETDTLVTETNTNTFKLWKDIDAFVDPCDIAAGRLDLEGMDQVVAYFTEDPRFEVTRQQEFTIDGRRAVEITFDLGPNQTEPCWTFDGNESDRSAILTYIPHAAQGGFWNGRIGDPGLVVVTEVDGVSLVLEPLTFDFGIAVDRATLDTIRFLDALPTPPAS